VAQDLVVVLPAAEGLGFDQVLDRLRGVVDRLEEGKLSLEEQLTAFEEGVGLARRGQKALDSAEKRVEELLAKEGDPRTVPFAEDRGKE
jgi:exodeoxyribonuclease VII small subunit